MTDARLRECVPFLRCTDMAASLHFYCDQLGFRIALQWTPAGRIRWCRVERDAVALMLQELVDDHHDPVPLERPFGTGVSICIMCEDALALHEEAADRLLHPAHEPFVGNGLWVVGYVDPDGYRLEFESPTDVPEETTLRAHRAGQAG